MRPWFVRVAAVAGTSALLTTAFAGSAGAAEPAAAPAQSHAEAQFLSGSLINGLIPFDYLLALRGASATNTGQPSPVVQRNNLLVTLLGLPIVNQPHGYSVNPGDALHGGYADQYAQASAGSSRAASGALSDSGVFGDNHSTNFPADATINLSAMEGAGPFSGLQDVSLKLSAVSSEAALSAGSVPASSCTDKTKPVNCLDYGAATGTLSFTSPELAKIPASVTAALAPINQSSAALQSAITKAVQGLQTGNAGLDSLLAALGGGSHLSATVNLDVAGAVVKALSADITAGGVTVNPTTGQITTARSSTVSEIY